MIFRAGCALLLVAGWLPSAPADQVVVLTTAGVAAYDEVLDGIRKSVGSQVPLRVIDLRQKDAAHSLADALHSKTTRVVVTIGSEAAEAAVTQPAPAPLIATTIMPNLLAADAAAHGRTITVVPVDVPLNTLLDNVKRVFPGKSRLGIIRNAALPNSSAETLKALAEAAGFKIFVADCDGPAQLLQTFVSLKDHADLVICFPDGVLYNSATVKPLVLASLRYRLPLVAFSESFTRAGAALSVYPDFREVGSLTGELILKTLNGPPQARIEHPRKFKLAVNQNITRLLGLSYKEPAGLGDDFLVIR